MIIITGGTGFIGSNIVAQLNAQGRTDLILVDDLADGSKWKNIAKRRFQDIVLPSEADDLMKRLNRADAVFHMGANSSTTSTDGNEILKTNLRASMRWWQWCTERGVPLVYASSAATYGAGEKGFQDDEAALDHLRPLNLYGWSKHAFDKWATEKARAGEAPPQWAGLKFFNVYGPNEYHKGSMQSLVAKNAPIVKAGDQVMLFRSHREGYADGGQLRDFVYVKDCVDVMLWLLDNPNAEGLFNLGTGEARTFLDFINAIGAAMDKGVQVHYVDMPESIRPNYQYFTQAAMGKLRATGYLRPLRSVEEGVRDYVRQHLLTEDQYL